MRSLNTTTTIGACSRTAVSRSPTRIRNPPSPVKQTTGALGSASFAPLAAGRDTATVPSPLRRAARAKNPLRPPRLPQVRRDDLVLPRVDREDARVIQRRARHADHA